MTRDRTPRRTVLRSAAVAGVCGVAGLAGCSANGDDDADDDDDERADGDPAIDAASATVTDVLDALAETYGSIGTYRTDSLNDSAVVMSELKGVDQVDEEELLEQWDGVLFEQIEETEVVVDTETQAYEETGTQAGEVLGTDVDEDVRDYYVDGTLYEFDDGPGGGEWEVDEDAEFEPPSDVEEFVGDSREVTEELSIETGDDGDSVVLSGSFSELPEPYQDDDQSDAFRLVTSYEFDVVVDAQSGLVETVSQEIEGNIDNVAILDILNAVPESAEGEFTVEEDVEFLAHDESVEITLPSGAPAE